MPLTFREMLSRKLIDSAAERALERQAMHRRLEAVSPQARGQREALAAVRTAALFESAMLWVGWRLQPRNVSWVDRHHV